MFMAIIFVTIHLQTNNTEPQHLNCYIVFLGHNSPIIDVGGMCCNAIVVVIVVPSCRHKWSHVQMFRKRYEC